MQYGMPAIGDLFRGRTSDIQETVNSVYYMLKQRINDIDSRNEFRSKISKAECQVSDFKQQVARSDTKIESFKKEVNDYKNKLQNLTAKHKEDLSKLTTERDELIKALTKVEHKEAQYKHEIKNREIQI